MKKFITITLVIILVVSGLWWFFKGRSVEPPESVMPKNTDIATTISVNATYTPEKYAHISAETPAKIAWVGVDIGDSVTVGQTLVRLDRASLNARIRSAQLGVERAELVEQESRRKSSHMSSKQILGLKKASEQARQNLNEVYAMTAKTNLTTPLSGIITVMNARMGEIVGGTLVRIIDPKSLSVEAFVSETDIVSMQVGQDATIEFDALNNTHFDATISHIDPEAISIQDVIYFRTLFTLDNTTTQIRPGMTGDIEITIAQKDNALTIPIRFIRRDDTGTYVSVKEPNEDFYTKRYVTTGIESDDGLVEIIEGISANTRIYAIHEEE